MDLRALELRLELKEVRLTVADAAGERRTVLTGEPFQRIALAAKPLVTLLSGRAGPVFALSIDTVRRVAHAAGGEGGTRLQGAEYDGIAATVTELARAAIAEVRTRIPDPAGTPSQADFWVGLYRRGGDGWELGRASPPLQRWFAEHPPADRRVLVVGCGRGHEARLVARMGAEVTAIDFAPEAVAAAEALAEREGVKVDFRVRDLFSLAPAGGDGPYDLVVEHCCFCAIEVARRDDYVRVMADVLVDGGQLVGLFYSHGRAGGPPFSVSRDELDRHFAPRFERVHEETPYDSAAARQGQEILAVWKKRTFS